MTNNSFPVAEGKEKTVNPAIESLFISNSGRKKYLVLSVGVKNARQNTSSLHKFTQAIRRMKK
jgi:predicted transcriptional regulator